MTSLLCESEETYVLVEKRRGKRALIDRRTLGSAHVRPKAIIPIFGHCNSVFFPFGEKQDMKGSQNRDEPLVAIH
jgi:hypothetical protein